MNIVFLLLLASRHSCYLLKIISHIAIYTEINPAFQLKASKSHCTLKFNIEASPLWRYLQMRRSTHYVPSILLHW